MAHTLPSRCRSWRGDKISNTRYGEECSRPRWLEDAVFQGVSDQMVDNGALPANAVDSAKIGPAPVQAQEYEDDGADDAVERLLR